MFDHFGLFVAHTGAIGPIGPIGPIGSGAQCFKRTWHGKHRRRGRQGMETSESGMSRALRRDHRYCCLASFSFFL